MSEKLLVDCGYFKGDFTRDFLSAHPSGWEVVAFDPVPIKTRFTHPAVTFYPKAIWTFDGETTVFLASRPDGNSIIPGKNNCASVGRTVPCVDFSRWLEENAKDRKEVQCKMDVEGAEYAVLQRLLDTGNIKYINDLTVEFHWERLPQEYRKIHRRLWRQLKRAGPIIHLWR